MANHDSATRAQLSGLLHRLGGFCLDAAREVDRDSLIDTMERLAPGQPAAPGHGAQYLALARHLAEAVALISAYSGEIAGGRKREDELRREHELAGFRASASPPPQERPLPTVRVRRDDPALEAQIDAFRSRHGVVATGPQVTRALADQPPDDRVVEAAAYRGKA